LDMVTILVSSMAVIMVTIIIMAIQTLAISDIGVNLFI
jgi:hypothetical protein